MQMSGHAFGPPVSTDSRKNFPAKKKYGKMRKLWQALQRSLFFPSSSYISRESDANFASSERNCTDFNLIWCNEEVASRGYLGEDYYVAVIRLEIFAQGLLRYFVFRLELKTRNFIANIGKTFFFTMWPTSCNLNTLFETDFQTSKYEVSSRTRRL